MIRACIKLTLLTGLLLVPSSRLALAQGKKLYASVSYIKINPGKAETYFNLINNYSPMITAARIKRGGVLSWAMYKLRIPEGSANAYDLVSVTVVDDYSLMFDDLAPADSVMKKILPGATDKTIAEIFVKYEQSRVTVRKEIYELGISEGGTGRYAMVDFSDVAETPGVSTERTAWIKSGELKGIKVLERNVPLEAPAALRVYYVDDMDKLAKPVWDKRDVVSARHREIWELVQRVGEP